MKLVLFALACTACTTVYAKGLKNKLEIAASCGIHPPRTMQDRLLGHGQLSTQLTWTTFATVRYRVSNRLAVGLAMGTQHFPTAPYYDYYASPNTPSQRSQLHNTCVSSEVLGYYVNRSLIRAYTYLGIGCSLYKQSDEYFLSGYPSEKHEHNYSALNMQYVPLGISVGHRLSGFAEIGVGYKGIVNAGISYRMLQRPHALHGEAPSEPTTK